jgi:hypothetical protein
MLTLWPVSGTFTGRQLRQAIGAFWGGLAARPLGARSGVVVGTPTSTVTASASTWTVKPHSGVLDVEALAIAGPYNYSVDANVTGTMNAADNTYDRVDLISVTMSDTSEGDASTAGPTFVYTVGTPASTALPPTTPARNVALATIRVPKLGTGSPSVTWIAPWAVAAGGILPCTDSTYYPVSPYTGQYVDDATLGLQRWDGGQWTDASPLGKISVAKSSAFNVPTSTDTTITGWAYTTSTGNSGFSYASGVWTCQVAGYYIGTGQLSFAPNATPAGQRVGRVNKNGVIVCETTGRADTAYPADRSLSFAGYLAVGDTISISAYQSQGDAEALSVSAGKCFWGMVRASG